jgi:hypothetical protein
MSDIYTISKSAVVKLNGEEYLLEIGDKLVVEAKQMARWHRPMLGGHEYEKLRDIMVELIPDDDTTMQNVLDGIISAPNSVIEPDIWDIWSHFYNRNIVPRIKIKGKYFNPYDLKRAYEKGSAEEVIVLEYPDGRETPKVSAKSAFNRMQKFLKSTDDRGKRIYSELAFLYLADKLADKLGVKSSEVVKRLESLQDVYTRARELYDQGPDAVKQFMSQHEEPLDAGDEPADYEEDDAFMGALESYAESLGYDSVGDIPPDEVEKIRKEIESEFDTGDRADDQEIELQKYQMRIGQVESEIEELSRRKRKLDPQKSTREVDALERQIEKKEELIDTLQSHMSHIAVHGSPHDNEDVDDGPYSDELDNDYDREEVIGLLRHDPEIASQFNALVDNVSP